MKPVVLCCLGAAVALLLVAGVLAVNGCEKTQANPVVNPPPNPAPAPTPAEKGKKLFKAKTCNSCHTIDGWGGQNAPDLTEVTTKYIKIKGDLTAAQDFYRNHIKDPDKFPGVDKKHFLFVKMPKILMTDEERECLIAYLSTLRKKE